jgi:hypothetical protein
MRLDMTIVAEYFPVDGAGVFLRTKSAYDDVFILS